MLKNKNVFSEFLSKTYSLLLDDQRDTITCLIRPPIIADTHSFVDMFSHINDQENKTLIEEIEETRKQINNASLVIIEIMATRPKTKENIVENLKNLDEKLGSYVLLCEQYITYLLDIVNYIVEEEAGDNNNNNTVYMTKANEGGFWSWTYPLILPINNNLPVAFSMNKLEMEVSFFTLIKEIMSLKKTLVELQYCEIEGTYCDRIEQFSTQFFEKLCKFDVLANKFDLNPNQDNWIIEDERDLLNFTVTFKATTKFFSIICGLLSRTSLLSTTTIKNQCHVKDLVIPQNDIVLSLYKSMKTFSLFDKIDFDKKLLVSLWQILGDALTFHDSLLKLFISLNLVEDCNALDIEETNSIAFLLISTCLNFPVQDSNDQTVAFLKKIRASKFIKEIKTHLIENTRYIDIKKMALINNKSFNTYWIEQIYGKDGDRYEHEIYSEWEFFTEPNKKGNENLLVTEKQSMINFSEYKKKNPILPINLSNPFKNDSRFFLKWMIGIYMDILTNDENNLISSIKNLLKTESSNQFTTVYQYKDVCHLKTDKFTFSNAQLFTMLIMIDFCYEHKGCLIPSKLEIEKNFSFYNSCLFYNVYTNGYTMTKKTDTYTEVSFHQKSKSYSFRHSHKNNEYKWISKYENIWYQEENNKINFFIVPPLLNLTSKKKHCKEINKITVLHNIKKSLEYINEKLCLGIKESKEYTQLINKYCEQIENECNQISEKSNVPNRFITFLYSFFLFCQKKK